MKTHASDGAAPLAGRAVLVLGYGHQGRAQALCLRDAGAKVAIGARPGPGFERARKDGFAPRGLAEAVCEAGVASGAGASANDPGYVACLLPDEALAEVFATHIAPHLRPGTAVVLAHGFAAVFGGLTVPAGCDLLLVAPAAPGSVFREEFERGRGVPCYAAVVTDGTGHAAKRARDYATALGATREGGTLIETNARAETEVDLFGEQAVVVGGVLELVQAAFDTLVEAGYDRRLAYLECVHQLKYLVDVIHDVGPDGLRDRISQTALFGALTRGPRVINAISRAAMENLLVEIQSGDFSAEWQAESRAGRGRLEALLAGARARGLRAAREAALGAEPAPEGPRTGPDRPVAAGG